MKIEKQNYISKNLLNILHPAHWWNPWKWWL